MRSTTADESQEHVTISPPGRSGGLEVRSFEGGGVQYVRTYVDYRVSLFIGISQHLVAINPLVIGSIVLCKRTGANTL
jgi:hypothetical protein